MFKKIKRILGIPMVGRYPACDHLNCALQFLLEDPHRNRFAIREILHAILRGNGYLYEHLKPELKRMGFDGLISSIEQYGKR